MAKRSHVVASSGSEDEDPHDPASANGSGSPAKRARLGESTRTSSSSQNQKTGSKSSHTRRKGSDGNDMSSDGSDAEDDNAEEEVAPSRTGTGKSKKAAKVTDIEEVDTRSSIAEQDGENNSDQEEDDAEGEEDAELADADAAVVTQGAAELRKRSGQGAIAEAGVVDAIILKNFMCHKFLEVKLNPQINFIIGHNGSGKSVILTGLIFAFGTKASHTNRAKSLNAFVQKGAPYCEVTVSLRNKGEEAFKPDVYGKTIHIIRRVNAEGGGGTYKIQDYQKKTVSTRRDEISAICDHFMIQMDNPVNILNQDMAKVFLHSQKPKDKYTFFLKGTQLAQLTDEYQKLLESVISIKNMLASKGEQLKDLKEASREAAQSWKEIEKSKNVETQIRKMKNELAWTLVVDVEKTLQEAVAEHLGIQQRVDRYDEAIKDLRRGLDVANAAVAQAEAAREDSDNTQADKDYVEHKTRLREITDQIKAVKSEHRRMLTDIERINGSLANYDEQLAHARKLADSNHVRRQQQEQAQARLVEVDNKIDDMQAKILDGKQSAAEIDHEISKKKADNDKARNEVEQARAVFTSVDQRLAQIQATKQNSLNAFGHGTMQIINAINNERNWVEKPIGPIGQFVKLKDASWARLTESLLGDMLNGFIVTHQGDRDRLNRLIRTVQGARQSVYLVEPDDRFVQSMQNGRPNERFTTLFDILSIDNIAVLKLLVDMAKIESSVVVRERREGDKIMQERHPNVLSCYTENCYRVGGIDGGSSMRALNMYNGAPRLSKDIEADIRSAQQAREDAERTVREIGEKRRQSDAEIAGLFTQKRQKDNEIGRLQAELRRTKSHRDELADAARIDTPTNIAAIEDSITEAKLELQNIEAQKAAADAQVQEIGRPVVALKQRMEEIRRLKEQRAMIAQAQTAELEKCVTHRTTTEHTLNERTKQKKKQEEKAQAAEKKVEEIGQNLQAAIDSATEICPRESVELSKEKTRKKYEAQISSLEKALREQERRVGGNSEDIYKRYVAAKAAYDNAKTEIDDLKVTIRQLMKSYEMRMDRWADFRTHIALRARMHFQHNLNMRGYTGDLKFRHDEQKLELRVRPNEDNAKTQRMKDVSTLSGGEKSFSTICLLLALWEAAGSPIRGLDEFDVFMDAMNRRIATKMLIAFGQASRAKQMILISPQALQGHLNTPGVKVIKIADPERGQGVLAAE